MSAVQAHQTTSGVAGHWRIVASANARSAVEVTYVRGVQTTIQNWSREDPFGTKAFSLIFPSVTIFDRLGSGELEHIRKDTNVDILWVGALPSGYPDGSFAIEGYMESFDFSQDGLTVSCKGAMYQLDNYQAKPEYLAQPLPYEVAMARQWDDRPDLRLRKPHIVFPPWWTTTFTTPSGTPKYLIPTGVTDAQQWTGLVTRSTGTWEPALTSYIQTLLSSMYTARGRWTWDMTTGRQPVLRHRDFVPDVIPGCLLIDPVTPGVDLSLQVDYSQSLNVLYGQGTALTGEGYSGQIPVEDGLRTEYQPLAALRQVDPVDNSEGWLDTDVMRRETLLQLQAGLDGDQAALVGASHLDHFADPGVQGTITLTCDPTFLGTTSDTVMNRMIIKEGMTIQVPRLFGIPEGLLFHISAVEVDFTASSVSLTVDTKYRDALTLAEVKLRGRDALAIQRSLIGGQYQPPIPDQLVPWNYAEGSGFIPSGQHYSSLSLFDSMPDTIQFPWQDWTQTRPPSDPAFRHCYMHIGPKSANANNNWTIAPDRSGGVGLAYPVKVSQAGTIRLIEIAAYDKNGNVLAVPFHVSFWYGRGAGVDSTPQLRDQDAPSGNGYATAQHYPFFKAAWEQYNIDGTNVLGEYPAAKSGAELIKAYGTGYVQAGFWPGSSVLGDLPTGMLQDETPLEFNCARDADSINPNTRKQAGQFPGYIFCLIYCDAQASQDVYFAGRMYRIEPGSNT